MIRVNNKIVLREIRSEKSQIPRNHKSSFLGKKSSKKTRVSSYHSGICAGSSDSKITQVVSER